MGGFSIMVPLIIWPRTLSNTGLTYLPVIHQKEGSPVTPTGIGNIESAALYIENGFLVLILTMNRLSIAQLCEQGHFVLFRLCCAGLFERKISGRKVLDELNLPWYSPTLLVSPKKFLILLTQFSIPSGTRSLELPSPSQAKESSPHSYFASFWASIAHSTLYWVGIFNILWHQNALPPEYLWISWFWFTKYLSSPTLIMHCKQNPLLIPTSNPPLTLITHFCTVIWEYRSIALPWWIELLNGKYKIPLSIYPDAFFLLLHVWEKWAQLSCSTICDWLGLRKCHRRTSYTRHLVSFLSHFCRRDIIMK